MNKIISATKLLLIPVVVKKKKKKKKTIPCLGVEWSDLCHDKGRS